MIKENQKYLNRMFVVLDGIVIFASLIIAWIIRFKLNLIPVAESYLTFREYIVPITFMVPIYLVIYGSFKLYEPQRFKKLSDEMSIITKANLLGLMLFVLLLYILKIIDYSRYLLLIFAFVIIIATSLERFIIRKILRRFREKGFNQKHMLIIGVSDTTAELQKKILKNKQWGYNILGIFENNMSERPNILGDISELESYLNNHPVDDVFITLEMSRYDELKDIINVCEKNGVRTSIVPAYFKYIPARPYLEEIDGLPIINIRYVPLDNLLNRAIKRTIDVLGALLALLVFSPIMLIAAIAVKITSEGPVFFKQERVGLNKKPFMMLKFRSMRVQRPDDEKIKWTKQDDPRKTRVGAFIRKTSIDELPQIFNVLLGDMSMVGPRPERPHFVEQFKEEIPRYMIKHQIRPGITGWAQVNGWRGDTSIKKRIEFDLYYIENWNLWFDIRIIWLTIFKGFINKNAY